MTKHRLVFSFMAALLLSACTLSTEGPGGAESAFLDGTVVPIAPINPADFQID